VKIPRFWLSYVPKSFLMLIRQFLFPFPQWIPVVHHTSEIHQAHIFLVVLLYSNVKEEKMMIMYLWCPSSSAGFQNIMVYWLRNPFLIIPCKPFSWWILPFPSRFPCSDYSVCIYSTHIRVQCGILSSTTSCLFLTSSRLLNIIHPYFSSFVIFEHFWEDLLRKVLPSHVDFCFFSALYLEISYMSHEGGDVSYIVFVLVATFGSALCIHIGSCVS
jgi:hypothetical protein